MNDKQAAAVWKELRGLHYGVTARHLEVGPLGGEHVVEVEPHPTLTTNDFHALLHICELRSLELSYGKSPRRVLVLS